MRVLPRQALASELKEKHGANYEVSYVVADFVNADDAAWARIASEVRAVDVGMLFNNVGMSYPHAEFLHNLDATLVDDLIRVNVECTTKMTRIVLPGMVFLASASIYLLLSFSRDPRVGPNPSPSPDLFAPSLKGHQSE